MHVLQYYIIWYYSIIIFPPVEDGQLRRSLFATRDVTLLWYDIIQYQPAESAGIAKESTAMPSPFDAKG